MNEGRFEQIFGRRPIAAAWAPGRVNLIGEHTDYNGGHVLPMATPHQTLVELLPRDDGIVRARSLDPRFAGQTPAYRLGEEARRGEWIDYLQGITAVLREAGLEVPGFDALITSEVPVGSGLSSSAALEIALLRALRVAFALPLDDLAIAILGQRAENQFVGVPVGIMDQMASSLSDTHSALFLDTSTLEYEVVPFPESGELAIIDSGVSHDHATGEYRVRRAECEQAAALLGVAKLGELGMADLPRVAQLPDPLDRRVRHVITEDERVTRAVAAMRAGDLRALGELFYASHASMRDDYEVSIPEIDLLVDLARKEPDVYGARLTGGGFGGAVVLLANKGRARAAAERIAQSYGELTQRRAEILAPLPAPQKTPLPAPETVPSP